MKKSKYTCIICGTGFYTKHTKRGRKLCDNPHCKSVHASQTMRKTNLKHSKKISERMKTNNPSFNPKNILKMKETKRLNGTLHNTPVVQGGNGKPLPIPQMILSSVLGWKTEYPILTLQKKGSGYPTSYKVDVGLPELKIAIEVDGRSHYSRKHLDRKKDHFLTQLGWKMLRFTNQDVLKGLPVVLTTVKNAVKSR